MSSTANELAALGVREHAVAIDELDAAFAEALSDVGSPPSPSIAPTSIGHTPVEPLPVWRTRADSRSARLARALATLVARHGAACGTVNCHGPWLRENPQIGICACFGVSVLTERGIPFSCTGDQPTALTLLLARRLTGRALYCELYTPELVSGLMLLAAGGEGDPAWAQPGTPIFVEPNHHYPGANGTGSALAFRLAPGPATVLSLSPAHHSWNLAWATGEVIETRYAHMGGPNAMFRFDSGPADEASARWIASGATHHSALAVGRLDVEVPVLARELGVEPVRV